jgi:hypothetical protein
LLRAAAGRLPLARPDLSANKRPRNRDVESRLRNLESLLATISSGGPSAAISLSRRELDQIRVAAHIAPGSDTSPSSDNDAANQASAAAVASANANASGSASAKTANKQQQQQQWGATPTPTANAGTPSVNTPQSAVAPTPGSTAPGPRNLDSNYVPSIVFDPFGVPSPSQAPPDMTNNPQLQQTMYDPNAVAANYNPATTKSPVATTKGQDLLYRYVSRIIFFHPRL